MINYVVVKPAAQAFELHCWTRERESYVEDARPGDFWRFADAELRIEPGVVVGDFVRCLREAVDDIQWTLGDYCKISLRDLFDEFADDMRNTPALDVREARFEAAVDCARYAEGEKFQFQPFWTFHGWGPLGEDQGEGGISFSLTHPADLWNLPLRVETAMTIGVYDCTKDIGDPDNYRKLLDVEIRPTLLDATRAFLWELGFHGTTKAREKVLADLKAQLTEIDEGRAELISFDDVKARMDDLLGKKK